MDITAAHWIYLSGIIVIIGVMIARKNVVVPAVAATFLTAWMFTGNLAKGLSAVFNASLVAASELFSIFLIIALMTALLGALRAMGADRRMVAPFQKAMRNGSSAFVVIFVVTYLISLFFWPTPAVPLIGAILLPAAIRAGLPAMAGAVAIAIAGQGMALSSDYVIQVAPGLSAVAAGVETAVVADRAMVLSLITGLVAVAVAFIRLRPKFLAPSDELLVEWERIGEDGVRRQQGVCSRRAHEGVDRPAAPVVRRQLRRPVGPGAPLLEFDEADAQIREPVKRSQAFAIIVPIVFLTVVTYMILGKFTDLVPATAGGDAAGPIGGAAAILLLVATVTVDGKQCLETCATHVVDGLVFAFKAMGVVIPIAGFFFIGNSDFAAESWASRRAQHPPLSCSTWSPRSRMEFRTYRSLWASASCSSAWQPASTARASPGCRSPGRCREHSAPPPASMWRPWRQSVRWVPSGPAAAR